jgi:hypothetical protein
MTAEENEKYLDTRRKQLLLQLIQKKIKQQNDYHQ